MTNWFLICTDALHPVTHQPLGIVAYTADNDDVLWVCTKNEAGYYDGWEQIVKDPYLRLQTPPVSIGGAFGVFIPAESDPAQTLLTGYNVGHLNAIRVRTVKLTLMMGHFKQSRLNGLVPWPPQ